MLRDVFYYGDKPNVHPKEEFAENLADARSKATTRDFWIINEFCDYRGFDWDFDFDFLPDEDVWAEAHNNVWPSQHQKDSGTWLCPKEHSDLIIYRGDVNPVKRKNERTSHWVLLENIDESKFDFSWHPDPTSPPYIYKWGCKFFPAELQHVLEYHAAGSTNGKYMTTVAELLPNNDCWTEHDLIDRTKFDMSWRPDPREPAYIYVWGNKWIDGKLRPTLTYHIPGATETKYMNNDVPVLPEKDRWVEVQAVDKSKFDFSWRPDPREPAYIYVWGNKWIDGKLRPTLTYHIPGATETKYMNNDVPVLPEKDRWVEVQAVDKSKFDFSWRPDPREPDLIYVFGNQYYDAIKMPTLEYHCDGATERKYMDLIAELSPNPKLFEHLEDSYLEDYAWHPDPDSPPYIYVWGNQWNIPEVKISVQFVVEGATEYKYMSGQAVRNACMDNWIISDDIDTIGFDFSWEPNPAEPPLVYEFGTQWQKTGGPKYITPGCTKDCPVKYIDTLIATRLPNKKNFVILDNLTVDDFDYSWHPDQTEEPYIYVFGNQHYSAEIYPTIEYHTPNAVEKKYIHDTVAKISADRSKFKILHPILEDKFDFTWIPNPNDPPYIYVFGNTQYSSEEMPTVEYHVDGATDRKYINDAVARLSPNMDNWDIPKNIDISSFDFSWVPHPSAPPYIYEFATIWNDRGGPKYVVKGATEYTYIEDIKAKTLPNRTNWEIPDGVDVSRFDFSWIPHPLSPPYIYQFGTKLDNNDGPRYIALGNSSEIVYKERVEVSNVDTIRVGQYYIKTTLEDLVREHPDEIFWALRKNINYDTFDFSWKPETVGVAYELGYVHVFGSVDSESTQTYFVSARQYLEGNKDLKFVEQLDISEKTLSQIFIKPDMFYVDKGNSESSSRFEVLKERFGNKIQKTRYLNSWVDTVNRCTNRSTTDLLWILNSELDYSNFNFDYYPNPWQMKMVHIFGTQWSHWGTTFMVNRESFSEDTKYIKIIEHLSNLNFVKDIRANATKCSHDIVVIDHGNKETSGVVVTLQKKAPDRNVTITKYNNSYLDTLTEIIKRLPEKKEHFIWVCSSVCDYTDFDFAYIIDPFSRDNLHVFPSGKQKFGDTFFIDVNNAREVISELEQLENFTKVNYNGAVKAVRLQEPIIVISDDTYTNSVDKINDFPYATFVTSDNADISKVDIEPMNLWSAETKNIYVTSTGATRIVVPKEIKDHVTKELYEYPYIKRAPKLSLSNPLDIVFLSNGETGAEENYEHLLNVTKNLPNRVVRVDGVNGRAAAYHAAAEASETSWMFAVFAKLKVSPKFDFNWQPDRMQVPKHYIFHAKNPVNGLIYGHQAMIAYNKKLTLANDGKGLDFTLDDEHEVVPLISGVAQYNTDKFSTWRTAFREVIKLRADDSEVSKERLDVWLNKAEGDFAQYSTKGALDAYEYYDQVAEDFDKLKLSYEWAWLREKFDQI